MFRRTAGSQAHTLLQTFALGIVQVIQLCIRGPLGQILIAGFQFVDQLFIDRSNAQPHFAGRHFINRQLRAVLEHKVLEQLMGDIQVLLELFDLFRCFRQIP